jgi:imidazolonepropionase-like amidohydrolase
MKPITLLAMLASVALAPLTLAGAARAEPIVIDHVTVVEGTGRAAQPDMTVVVDGERIVRVIPSAIDGHPAGHHIDGTGKWLIPGLMDMHIHLEGAFDPTQPAGKGHAVNREEGLGKLASFIYAGVTSIYDAGNNPELILPLRADERAGKIQSPRIFATGNLVTYPGSHGSVIAVTIQSWPADKEKLEKYFAEQQPDMAKITLEEEGWGARPMIPLLPEDLLQEIIKFDNLHGVRTTIHVSSELRAEEAIYAGTDTLAHPVIQGPVSDSFVKLMAAKKIPFATTLTIGENYGRLVDHPDYLDEPLYVASFSPAERDYMKTKERDNFATTRKVWTGYMRVMTPVAMENIRKVDAAGGVACLGTDETSGASTHHELDLLIQAGIPAPQVLRIATYNCALFMGKDADLGSVREGRLADLVLLNADPLANIDNTADISWVMKGGKIVDESKLPLPGGHYPMRPGAR